MRLTGRGVLARNSTGGVEKYIELVTTIEKILNPSRLDGPNPSNFLETRFSTSE